ncbi:hypothetical protein CBR_g38458 [Chara braunii]|uniref:DNA mismatch repair proteins mutS family domain-containing protein n=1 Tax=Chara braunii TaxID=69332 RepID=A0A388JNV1_CHABU|nr:hypothetical protein CBR_g38458 [Chara braunii]|eukprot:GBG59433.1 hypothetical protein CBR_g38458 [Chara braunii]
MGFYEAQQQKEQEERDWYTCQEGIAGEDRELNDASLENDRDVHDAHGGRLEIIMNLPELVVQAMTLMVRYLRQFGLEEILTMESSFRPLSRSSEMNLSANALCQLEILQNKADGREKGSLLWLMDQTHTAFGARLMWHWVSHPLKDRSMIEARLDAVSEIAESIASSTTTLGEGRFPGSGKGGGGASMSGVGGAGISGSGSRAGQGVLGSVLSTLKRSPDLERGITRIFHRTATPAEFVSVIQVLSSAAKSTRRLIGEQHEAESSGESQEAGRPCISAEECSIGTLARGSVRSSLLKRLMMAASSHKVLEESARMLSAVNVTAAIAGDKLQLFNCSTGRFPEVARCKAAIKAAEKKLDDLLPELRKLLRMHSLQYTSVSGTHYLIEVPLDQRVPADWIKVTSTKKVHRYHPPAVLNAYDKLALAKEEHSASCSRAWETYLAEFSKHYTDFRNAVQALAALDCLYALAILSRNQGYVRPEFVDDAAPSQLVISDGRHPVLEATLQDGFVPNDTKLEEVGEKCQIITGPNMGGKSCYIRQVALITIMAQVGSYVPATVARLHVVDGVYTRMGASDSLQKGRSTFLEELSETSSILQGATNRSLVIIDELGRGTSTHDGVAIAYATLKHLLKETKCLTLFVTHYPSVAELVVEFTGQVAAYFVSFLASQSSQTAAASSLKAGKVDAQHAHKGTSDGAGAGKESASDITFLYKLVPGVASCSFGLHVAKLAEIPQAVIDRAAVMASSLQAEVLAREKLRSRNVLAQHNSDRASLPSSARQVEDSADELQRSEDERLRLFGSAPHRVFRNEVAGDGHGHTGNENELSLQSLKEGQGHNEGERSGSVLKLQSKEGDQGQRDDEVRSITYGCNSKGFSELMSAAKDALCLTMKAVRRGEVDVQDMKLLQTKASALI